jgi:tripartite-type tricarboxylate transporter receptor subunit TctC
MGVLWSPAVYAQPSWQVVTPVEVPAHRLDIGQIFASRLEALHGSRVSVNSVLHGGGVKALESVLQPNAAPPYSLVLMAEELALVGDAAKASAQHVSHYSPLLVVLETRWCLFGRADGPVTDARQLLSWARHKASAPRVAIPVTSGRVRLWVQGMAQRTHRDWQMDTYGVGGEFSQALHQGTDLALGRCDQQWQHAHRMRILAKGAEIEDGFLPGVPNFSELGWVPFGNGWLAWMAPNRVPPAERNAMAQHLYKISQEREVQAHLLGTEQVMVNLTPQASASYIEKFTQTWNQIGHLLLDQDFGNLKKMQGLAKPRP